MPTQAYAIRIGCWLTRTALAIGLTLVCAQADAGSRVALVIGNGAYRSVSPLPNPVRDADSVRQVLEDAGFDVVHASDVTAEGMRASLDIFAGKADQASEAVVYFAGHAVQMFGANHLLPVDLTISQPSDIARQSLSLDDILKRLDATSAKAKIVILDACRDNPFVANQGVRGLAVALVDDGAAGGAERALGSEAGLARVASKGGTLVAFSTSPGSTAADGTGAHSPYTAAFLDLVREPGLPVEQLFRQVRSKVDETTGGTQLPWETSSLTASFSFFAAAANVAGAETHASERADLSRVRPSEASLRDSGGSDAYRTAIHWDDPLIYRHFLVLYPEDRRALRIHRILSQRREEVAWSLVAGGSSEDLRLFLSLYPESVHLAEAQALLAKAANRAPSRIAALCPVPKPILAPAPPIRTRKVERVPTEIKAPPAQPLKAAAKAPVEKPAVKPPAPKPSIVRAVKPPVSIVAAPLRPIRPRPLPRVENDDDDEIETEALPRRPLVRRPAFRDLEPEVARTYPGRDFPRRRLSRETADPDDGPQPDRYGDERPSFGGSISGGSISGSLGGLGRRDFGRGAGGLGGSYGFSRR